MSVRWANKSDIGTLAAGDKIPVTDIDDINPVSGEPKDKYTTPAEIAAYVSANLTDDIVTNADLAEMAQSTIKGRAAAAGTGNPTDLTPAQAKTILGLATTTTDNAIIRADGTTGGTQNSGVTIDDSDNVIAPGNFTLSGAGGFWTDDSTVKIARIKDRLFVGAGVDYDGAFADGGADSWLGNPSGVNYHWVERSGLVNAVHQQGGIGVVGASRNGDKAGIVGQTTIGVAGIACSTASEGSAVYGGYFEGQRLGNFTPLVFGIEVDAKNLGPSVALNPYAHNSNGATVGLWVAGGGDPGLNPPTAPSSAAIVVLRNSEQWNSGIVFDNDAVVGTDGVTGNGDAITMARGHQIKWYYAGGNTGAIIRSTVDAAGSNITQTFDDKTVFFANDDGKGFMSLRYVDDSVNYADIVGGVTGTGPTISAQGDDTDVDLRLDAKGAGQIRLLDAVVPNSSTIAIASARNMGTWYVLSSSAAAVSVGATTAETALATIAVPAAAMGANGVLRITTMWTVNNNANAKTGTIRFGGIGGTGYGTQAMGSTLTQRHQVIIQNRNSASSQIGVVSGAGTGGWGTSSSGFTTGAINTANAQDIVITGTKGNSGDTLTLEAYTVELMSIV